MRALRKALPAVSLAVAQLAAAEGQAVKQAATAGHGMEEVVVTARKRQESLQDVPVSITPFSAQDMAQRGFTGMEDIAAATPGFTFDGSITSGHHSNAVIRGLAPQFTIARVQNVSFFMDGVYLPRQSMLNIGLVDMQRIEVVKGPQNALYGRNAFAGAVNYIPALPSDELSGYVSLMVGSDEREDLRVAVGGPITEDGRWLVRAGYGLSRYDGHTRNDHPVADANPAGPNTRGRLGGWDDEAINIGLSFQATDSLAMRLGYYRSEVLRETQPGYMISGLGATGFGLRTEEENDLNCNYSTQPDISGNQMVSGNTLYCGELPNAASDVSDRRVAGIVIDPRGIGAQGDTDFYTFALDWDLSDSLSAHYLFGYADHFSETTGGPGGEDPIKGQRIATNIPLSLLGGENGITRINSFSGRPNIDAKTFSNELRFDWLASESTLLSGGFYHAVVQDTEWVQLFLNSLCNADTAENIHNCNTPTSAPSPILTEATATAPIVWDQGSRQHAKAKGEWSEFEDEIYALFASLSIDINERLAATLEGRYSIEKKSVKRLTDSFAIADGQTFTYSVGEDPIVPLPPDSVSGNGSGRPDQTTLVDGIIVPEDSKVYRYFTPRLTLDYQINDDQKLFVALARGLKTGGFNNAEAESQLTYKVAQSYNLEVGSKNSFFHNSLIVNGALFYIDWRDLQGPQPPVNASLSSSDLIANVGDAVSYGIELEVMYNINRFFNIDLGYTYNDASYKKGVVFSPATNRVDCAASDVCPDDGDVGGNQMPRSSRQQANIGLNLNLPLFSAWHMNARVDANYQSKQFVTPLNVTTLPERTVTNASLNLSSPDDRWTVNLWGKNILDEDVASYAFYITIFNQYLVSKLPGPSYGASVKYAL
ncbi:TonB-dependent receptor [Spongiibacter sp.]|uniref:TonB-dependent receptor n=1 Tax=Spongiibacter sp. TaxID=2024860 RepID=UPI00356223E6